MRKRARPRTGGHCDCSWQERGCQTDRGVAMAAKRIRLVLEQVRPTVVLAGPVLVRADRGSTCRLPDRPRLCSTRSASDSESSRSIWELALPGMSSRIVVRSSPGARADARTPWRANGTGARAINEPVVAQPPSGAASAWALASAARQRRTRSALPVSSGCRHDSTFGHRAKTAGPGLGGGDGSVWSIGTGLLEVRTVGYGRPPSARDRNARRRS